MDNATIIKLISLWVLFGIWGIVIELKSQNDKMILFCDWICVPLAIIGGGLIFLYEIISMIEFNLFRYVTKEFHFPKEKILNWFFQKVEITEDMKEYFALFFYGIIFLVGAFNTGKFIVDLFLKLIK